MKTFHLYKKDFNYEDDRVDQYLYVYNPYTGRFGFHDVTDRFCPDGVPLTEKEIDFILAGDISNKYTALEINSTSTQPWKSIESIKEILPS